MIHGNKKRKIRSFLMIDHSGEKSEDWTVPGEGEEFIGYPYGWSSASSSPFIEVRSGGSSVRTINALDCSIIDFVAGEIRW